MKAYRISQTTDAHSEQIPVDLGLVTTDGRAIEPISEIESLRNENALLKAQVAQERARCARIADAVAADFCADPDLPSGCQAARTIADAIRSGEDAPSELATQCAELVRKWRKEWEQLDDHHNEYDESGLCVYEMCAKDVAALPDVAAVLKGEV